MLKKGVAAGPHYVLPPIKTEREECDETSSQPYYQYGTRFLYILDHLIHFDTFLHCGLDMGCTETHGSSGFGFEQ